MKEEFEKKTKQINFHTSSEADRVIGDVGGLVEGVYAGIQAKQDEQHAETQKKLDKLQKDWLQGGMTT